MLEFALTFKFRKQKASITSLVKYVRISILILAAVLLVLPLQLNLSKLSLSSLVSLSGLVATGLSDHPLNVMALLLTSVFGLLYLHVWKLYRYWTKLGVPCSQPNFFVGHTLKRFGITEPILEFYENLYYNHNGKDFCGFYDFLKPGLVVGNLELIRNIIIKDFDHFSNRRVLPMAKVNKIANEMLSNATGEDWRRIRSAISPVFSSRKLRQLYPLICKQSNEFIRMLSTAGKDKKELKMRVICGQFTMDTIASCAFGIECEAMNADRAEFATMASKIFILSPARAIKLITLLTAPFLAHWVQLLGVDFTSEEFHFFHNVVSKTLRMRKEKGIRRGDFLDLMEDTHKLSETTMTSQAVLFILAGHNNTASALSFTFHLLAMNQDVQNRLREELVEATNVYGTDIDSEILQKLPLLDCVVKESLRLYPADPTLERLCTKEYQIPGTNVCIKENQSVIIPIWCIHRDPSNWSDPNDFKPERFLDHKTKDFGPYLPFGMGPRQCIGLKFVNLVVKVGLQKTLLNYRIIPSPTTIHPPPISSKSYLSMMPVNGLPLAIEPLVQHDVSVLRNRSACKEDI